MAETNRILKLGGIVAVAYISRYFIVGMLGQQFPELVKKDVLKLLLETGTVSTELADRFLRVGYFATPDEIESLIKESGFNIEDHVATDGFGRYLAQSVNNFNEKQYQAWLQYHLNICREKSLLGSSNHGLVLGLKTANIT